jgi:hypothetical protein
MQLAKLEKLTYTGSVLSIAHTLISLPFAIFFENPLLIFVAAAVWHVFCDTLLHWNIYAPDFKRYPVELIVLDVGGGLVAAWLVMGDALFTLPVLAAIAGGNAPDIVHGVWDLLRPHQRQWLGWARGWFAFHENTQLETTSVWQGLISQIVLSAAAIVLVISY